MSTSIIAASRYGSITGNCNLKGGDGKLLTVKGTAGRVYNILSDSYLAFNAKVNKIDNLGNNGITESSIKVQGAISKNVIFYDKTGTAKLVTYGLAGSVETMVLRGHTYKLADGGTLAFEQAYNENYALEERLVVTTKEGYKITQVIKNGSYIDSTVETSALGVFTDSKLPTGLLGHTFNKNSTNTNQIPLDYNPLVYDLGSNIRTVALKNINSPYVPPMTLNTIRGTENSDNLVATSSKLTILGLGGDDHIKNIFYNNVLDGGDGNDFIEDYGLRNTIYGGLGDDTIFSANGNGVIHAGNGDDVVTVQVGSDVVYGEAGNDTVNLYGATKRTVYGGDGDDSINAYSGNNKLYGDAGDDVITTFGSGNDTINGGAGADTMIGGSGNNVFYVDDIGDIVIKQGNRGFSEVKSTISYQLTDNIKTLTLLGSDDLNGTGNDLNNLILGNSGNNIIDGGMGSDYMKGGQGNDTYYVDRFYDFITERVSEGTDEVKSTVSYYLTRNVENLTLLGTSGINGRGNSLNNIILGNKGNNLLDSGNGNDTLTGGAGNDVLYGGRNNDTYIFNKSDGIDTIHDINGNDLIKFGDAVNKDEIALFVDKYGHLNISYENSDKIKILNWSKTSYSIEKIELNDGSYLSNTDINKIVQDMTAYAVANGISLSSVDSVKNDVVLMNIINTAWHS